MKLTVTTPMAVVLDTGDAVHQHRHEPCSHDLVRRGASVQRVFAWKAMHHSHCAETEMPTLINSLVFMSSAGPASAFFMKLKKASVSAGCSLSSLSRNPFISCRRPDMLVQMPDSQFQTESHCWLDSSRRQTRIDASPRLTSQHGR